MTKEKLPLSKLYRIVYQATESTYRADADDLLKTLVYQAATYYPRLQTILVPKGHSAPPRWEEPLVQRYIQNYLKMLSTQPGINNDHIDSDPVYANIVNPDVRKVILERRMDEKTYNHIYCQVNKLEALALPGGFTTTEVAVRSQGKLVPYEQIRRRFDDLPPSLLAVESGLQTQTVKGMLERGLRGSQIVDTGFTMKERRTSSVVVERMIKQGINDYGKLIDTAREMQCTVKFILAIMEQLGPDNIDELATLVDTAASDISDFCSTRRVQPSRAWYILLKIYNGEARQDAERALDIFTGSYWQNWRQDRDWHEE